MKRTKIRLKKVVSFGPGRNVFWDADGNVMANGKTAVYAGRLNSALVNMIIRGPGNYLRMVPVEVNQIEWVG